MLIKICRSRDRAKAAKAVPGIGETYIAVAWSTNTTTFLVLLPYSIYLSGLALCGVGYDTEQLSLKKHNLMRPGSLGSLSDCQLKSPSCDGSGRSKNDNAVSKRNLFQVSYCHSHTSSPCYSYPNLTYPHRITIGNDYPGQRRLASGI